MASTIKIKRSSVAAKRPTTSDISTGELELNTKDQKLFSSNGTSVFELASASALANTNASIATQTSRITLVNTNLLATNTAIRALDAAKLSVANAATIYVTKVNPTTSGLLAHTGRATISTNLGVTGNTSVGGNLTLGNTTVNTVITPTTISLINIALVGF